MKQDVAFTLAVQHLTQLADQINDNQWHNPTPDSEWDVRNLLNHLLYENLWIPPLFAGKTIAEIGDKFAGDLLGDNPKLTFKNAIQQTLIVVKDPNNLKKSVQLSFGKTSGSEYLNQMLLDAVIHGWDLAIAIGVDTHIDPKLVQIAWEYLEPKAEAWRQAGAFGQSIVLTNDQKNNLQNRLLALTGRDPNWQSK